MDRFACYETCVQSVGWVSGFLRALHGQQPRVLREDFCGAAALSRRWVADLRRKGLEGSAVAVDLDPGALDRARDELLADPDAAAHVRLVRVDAVHAPVEPADACDVIFVGNFSIGYIHDRPTLVGYLRRSAQRLKLGAAGFGGGVFVCDTYDSPTKYTLGALQRRHPSKGHEIVHYTWEHRKADALTGMVTNAIHFRVELDGEIIAEHTDAFIYRWRLWSIPELREAMLEAGFASTEVHQEVNERPVALEHGSQMKEAGIVCVVGRV